MTYNVFGRTVISGQLFVVIPAMVSYQFLTYATIKLLCNVM